jgi:hypothetical protein
LTSEGKYTQAWEYVSILGILPRHDVLLGLLAALGGSLYDLDTDEGYMYAQSCYEYILRIDPDNINAYKNLILNMVLKDDSEGAFYKILTSFTAESSIGKKVKFVLTLCDYMCAWGHYGFTISCLNLIQIETLRRLYKYRPEICYDVLALEFECFFRLGDYREATILGKKISKKFYDVMNPEILAILAQTVDLSLQNDTLNNRKDQVLEILYKADNRYKTELEICKVNERESMQACHIFVLGSIISLTAGQDIDWSKAPWNEVV